MAANKSSRIFDVITRPTPFYHPGQRGDCGEPWRQPSPPPSKEGCVPVCWALVLWLGGGEASPPFSRRGWVWHSVRAQGGSEFGSVRWACTVSLGGGVRESVRWAGVRTAALMNIFFLTDQGAFNVFWIKVIYNNGSYLSLGWRFLMISFFNSRLFNNGSGKDNIFSKKRRGFVKPWKW